MIIVKIWGGIGNQLFQYVFGQYLHYRYNQEVRYDDNAFCTIEKERTRELNALSTNIEYDNSCLFSKYRGVKNRLLRFLFQLNFSHHYIEEDIYGDGKKLEMIIASINNNELYFFRGYWQDIKYYDWLVKNVPTFSLKGTAIPKELKSVQQSILDANVSISLHVRRGDYFLPKNISIYGVCDAEYYEKGLSIMRNRYPQAKVFVFSDDLEWVKENIHFDGETTFVPNYPVSQFSYIEMMSLCQHHIISNSSFSWWGAVLDDRSSSIVVCPNRWLLTSNKTIALKEWTHI